MEFDPQLLTQIIDGQNEEAKLSIEKSNLHLKVDLNGHTLLHHSAICSNLEITQYLLHKGCDINAQNLIGRTALIEALKCSLPYNQIHQQVIIILLEAGTDPFIADNKNLSPVRLILTMGLSALYPPILNALQNNFKKYCTDKDEATKKLVEAGVDFTYAIALKDAYIIEYMIKNYGPIERHFEGDRMPLHYAIVLRDIEITKLLVKYGADVNKIQGYWGDTAINYLYNNNESRDDRIEFEFLKVLLDAGAIPTLINQRRLVFQGVGVLKKGPREAIRLLLQSNLDFTTLDTAGRNVLCYLAQNTNPGIAEELEIYAASNKLDVNILDIQGLSPLHISAIFSNVDVLKFLLKKGAEVNLNDNQIQITPLFLAYMSTAPEHLSDKCVEILLQHNADPQFVRNMDNIQTTIFKAGMTEVNNKKNERLKPIIARLAWLEKSGTPIIEIIQSQINAEPTFKKYFKQCQRLLSKKIAGNITTFKLLNSNERKMAKFLKKRKLVKKLIKVNPKQKFKPTSHYYHNILKRRFSKALLYETLTDKASVVISQLSKYKFDKFHVITEKIMEYLNEEDLRKLHEMYSESEENGAASII